MALLGTLGFALYMVPAVLAPVVRWGDSEPDLRWAREGIGLWKPLTAEEIRRAPVHSLKPGYLLFLRFASSVIRGHPERSIIVVQSFLLWLSIAGGCLRLGKRNGMAVGVAAYLLLLLFLPIRDSASAIMTEAISIAGFLPLCIVAWERPQRARTVVLTALGCLALFWIRPNVGAVALLLVVLGWTLRRNYREAAGVAGVFVVGVFAVWAITAPYAGRDAKRALPDRFSSEAPNTTLRRRSSHGPGALGRSLPTRGSHDPSRTGSCRSPRLLLTERAISAGGLSTASSGSTTMTRAGQRSTVNSNGPAASGSLFSSCSLSRLA